MSTQNYGLLDQPLLEKAIGEPITTYIVKSGSNPGDNVVGSLLAITITAKSGKTYNLMYKYIDTEVGEVAQFVVMCRLFWLENCIYTKVIPHIQSLLPDWEPPIPKHYLSMNDDKSDYLLMEDMRAHGYTMKDKFKGYDFPQVSIVMKKIAQYHATTHYLIKYEGEKLFEKDGMTVLAKNLWTTPNPMMEESFYTRIKENITCSIQILKNKNPDVAEKLNEFLKRRGGLTQYLKFIGSLTDKKLFPCIIHGDLWLNNILIKEDSENNPVDAKFIDFQMARRGNIFEDLVYFFLCSTTPKFREENLIRALGIYHEEFVAQLKKIGCPPVPNFTRGFFIDSFYECLPAGFVFMHFAVPLQLGIPIGTLMAKVKEELGDGKEASESERTLIRLRHSPEAVERIEALTREAMDNGYL